MKHIQFSEHFNSREFDSPDERFSGLKMNKELIKKLEIIRMLLNVPVIISSGYRTKEHNAKVGGVVNSSHLSGNAVDIFTMNSKYRYKLVELALILDIPRIGINPKFVHLDVSTDKEKQILYLY